MKIPRLRVGDLIEVVWVDANSPHPSVWINLSDLIERDPAMRIRSAGYFVDRRDGYLAMAGDRSDSEDYEDAVNRVFFIPVGCIEGVRKVLD